jgi:hypothetical protein
MGIQNEYDNKMLTETVEVTMAPSKVDPNSDNQFIYINVMEQILVKKFSEYGAFKDFETLMKFANKFYSDDESISRYTNLLTKNKKLEQIILSKLDEFTNRRFALEALLLKQTEDEIESVNEVKIT